MENDFDTTRQLHARLNQLRSLGHVLDKLEVIVLGGTFSEYPKNYRDEFMNDLFYAANVYDTAHRPKRGLFEEQKLNKNAKYKIIGVSIETRPDSICKQELRRLRTYGVTRVQIGIQHTYDAILRNINRGHDSRSGVLAIKMLKANGFKVDVHVMPDLPGSDPDADARMLETVIAHPDYSPDYMKIYPCLDVEHTEIRRWKESGTWKPYAETNYDKLVDVIVGAKSIVPKYIRLNRIQRDFPEETPERIGYSSKTIRSNLRQLIQDVCERRGVKCACVRCREIKNDTYTGRPVYTVEHYEASDGREYFISANTNEDRLLGFVRLRVNASNDENVYFDEIRDAGIIREAHVYGFLASTTAGASSNEHVQHRGIGKCLVMMACVVAYSHGLRTSAVISGVGARGYYEKLGFRLRKPYGYMTMGLSFARIAWYIIKVFFIYNAHCVLRFVLPVLQGGHKLRQT
jgi:ELP3 family radical SAM enzyme/protein acetyltransferase